MAVVRCRPEPLDRRGWRAPGCDLLLEGSPGARAVRDLTVLIAPDSFKGSLTSVEVARALGTGWSRARPGDTVEHAPLGDGGEGSIHAVATAGGWGWVRPAAAGPPGRQT